MFYYNKLCLLPFLCLFGTCSFHTIRDLGLILDKPVSVNGSALIQRVVNAYEKSLRKALDKIMDKPVFANASTWVPRVVNGYRAALGDVPYQVGMRKLADKHWAIFSTFCGGSIIGPSKLLSAAHCFEDIKSGGCSKTVKLERDLVGDYFAVAGTLFTDEIYNFNDESSTQWRRLLTVIYPSLYDFPNNDIAVVMTSKPFIFNDHVAPIPIATRYIDYKGSCLASGFGLVQNKPVITSKYLMLAMLQLESQRLCANRVNIRNVICTSSKPSDVAKGDSGGPLVCTGTGEKSESPRGILVGITCGNVRLGAFTYSIFTRVSSFLEFVETNRAKSCQLMNCYFYVILIQLLN